MIELAFQSTKIRWQRRGKHLWFCLTDMAKASNKLVGHWSDLKSTQLFLTTFEGIIGMTIMESNVGGSPETTGTWAIQEVAIKFAGWCSVDFEIWMLDKIKTLMNEGTVSLTNPSPAELSRKQILEMALDSENARLALLVEVEKQQREIEHQKLLNAIKEEEIAIQKEKIIKWHPLVENYKQFLDCKGLISMDQAAKMLDTGKVRLYRVLRSYGIILPEKTEPYQKYMKYFKVRMKTRKYANAKGEFEVDSVPLFTPSGLNSVVKLLEKKAGDRETLMQYLKKPSLITGLEEEKEMDACEAIEDVLEKNPDNMTISDHLEASVKLGFHKD